MPQTVIGSTIEIEGELSGDEDVVLRGTLHGKISLSGALRVEQTGQVAADIQATDLQIAGDVRGQIHAIHGVELECEGRFAGECAARSVRVPEGAAFDGTVELLQDKSQSE